MTLPRTGRLPPVGISSSQKVFSSLSMASNDLIVGLNKYSHDASICIMEQSTGKVLFSQAKERISGKKHDGGGVSEIIEYAFKYLGVSLSDVKAVVSNNHHYRVLPFEKRLPFAAAINYEDMSLLKDSNLFPNAKHYELSHHLAHAWNVIGTAPFRSGLVVVMDGMGESYGAMAEDMAGIEENSGDYMHDLKLLRASPIAGESFVGQPVSLFPGSSYREAETAYLFDEYTITPVFKRWSRERSPSELYNHGFENMESLGAVYSRISSHILGDWNACGKVMGLGPWANRSKKEASQWGYPDSHINDLGLGTQFHHDVQCMSGNVYDGTFSINWDALENLKNTNAWKNEDSDALFGEMATIAQSVQSDLEKSALSFISSLKEATSDRHNNNLALCGGVALNSVMNGHITRESGFEQVFVPPCPGDEGIAVGCACYGLQRLREEEQAQQSLVKELTSGSTRALNKALQQYGGGGDMEQPDIESTSKVEEVSESTTEQPLVALPAVEFTPYQGADFSQDDIMDALDEMADWVSVDIIAADSSELVQHAVEQLAQGRVCAWFQGRSEFGQRALGHRSIIADPRNHKLRDFINKEVKQREWWRPLAPSVLDEFAGDWFYDLHSNGNCSPYMSLTATLRDEKAGEVPAVAHVDNTARLQTVRRQDNPLYHSLIEAFRQRTKVPMILNTSFNRKAQPIVETPLEAIQTFLATEGGIDVLYLNNYVVYKRGFPLKDSQSIEEVDPEMTVRAEPFYMSETSASNIQGTVSNGPGDPLRIRVDMGDKWMSLPDQLHFDLLQLVQPSSEEDGSPKVTGADLGTGNYVPAGVNGPEDEDIRVKELFEAMASYDEGNTNFDYSVFKSALQWLYDKQLISFEDPADMDLEQVFNGAEVLDLRGLGGDDGNAPPVGSLFG